MVLDKLLRAGEGRTVRRLARIADQVTAIEDDYLELTDADLRAETDLLKERIADGASLDDLLPEAFATVREASKRVLGMRHFDVQLMGGAALHLGNIAEMKTGEGKTLVSTLPAYLNGLSGKGVHVVTTNDYLARRDAEQMAKLMGFLGLTVGVIEPSMRPDQRKPAYDCDITHGTNNEFGFDYLRDNMAWSATELVQRGHNFVIVDEVDSILVDEARTPLIISGPAEQSAQWYTTFARIVTRLQPERDYEVDEGKRTIAVTEDGVERVEDQLGVENLYESINTPLVGYLQNALKAKELYKRDKDYIVTGGEVLIVDEFTGRVLAGRRYAEGMHQAIEAKEGVEIKDENQTLATITLQNYFRLYTKLSGMTGTAMTEAAEFDQIYSLGVVPIPTNRPMIRADESDVVYKTELAKFEAVVADIKEAHEAGQPVLVGTTSVEKSETLSSMLLRSGVPHEVLNAKYHEREASIIAQAGRKGAVTVATNMAGRGTDIQLGGNAEFLAAADLRARGIDPVGDPASYEQAWPAALEKAKGVVEAEHEEVVEAGGLYVLGTERHESRRIDNQLRGRSGRQGDPGLSRFYLSLGDDLMRLFNAAAVEGIMNRLAIPEDMPIESKLVSRAIRSAQTQVEQQNFEVRKNVLKYDDVINRQRQVVYAERRRVLDGEDISDEVATMIADTVAGYVAGATAEGYPEDWDLDELWTALGLLWPVSYPVSTYDEGRESITAEILTEDLQADAREAYAAREAKLGSETMRELERRVVISVLDRKWREHLYEMDYLQEGIGLRGYGQRDPLVEYQREGYDLFVQMMDAIKEESVGFLFNLDVQVEAENAAAAAAAPPSVFTGEVGQLGAMQEMPAELLSGGAGGSAVLATEPGENRTIEPVGVAAHAPHLPTAFEEHEQIDPADRYAPQHVGADLTADPAVAAGAQSPAPVAAGAQSPDPVAAAPVTAAPVTAAPAPPVAVPAAPPLLPAFGGPTQRPQGLTYSAPSVDGEAGVVRTTEPAAPAASSGSGSGSGGAKPAGQQQRSGGPNRNASRKKNKRRR